MNTTPQQTEFLSWKILPARLGATQAAWYLGFEPHEIPILIAGNLLKPLGKGLVDSRANYSAGQVSNLAASFQLDDSKTRRNKPRIYSDNSSPHPPGSQIRFL